ncbi:hypothetical protein [Pseudomonas aeruginosa]|uniref:hypothetical protein n=1 Tax=Pseudomonas aeruginosa TaxID=287 RepID=UPI00136006FD|nr:hypothetical protein [Pseudomonas aeruginosa]MWW08597.1 hypothetical protein [Pseudomonas aeruginosa]
MSKHTPGPWNVDFIDGVDGVFAAGDKRICQVNEVDIVGWNVRFRDESEANAKLIAAAPDLLSIAERWAALDGSAWHLVRYEEEKRELLAATNEAISKATA